MFLCPKFSWVMFLLSLLPLCNARADDLGTMHVKVKLNACELTAFVAEMDPKGLNVRELPDINSKVLGVIPPVLLVKDGTDSAGYLVRPTVEVIDSNNGWIKIKDAEDTHLIEMKPRNVYKGEGWVSGSKLTVRTQSRTAYAKPSKTSEAIYDISPPDSWGYASPVTKATPFHDFDEDSFSLVSCSGGWALVRDRRLKEKNEYWLNLICGAEETTCDGLVDVDAKTKANWD